MVSLTESPELRPSRGGGNSSSTDDPPDLLAVLDALALACGVSFDPGKVKGLMTGIIGRFKAEAALAWPLRLTALAGEAGLRITVLRGRLDDALCTAGEGSPVLLWRFEPSGRGSCAVVVGRQGSRVQLASVPGGGPAEGISVGSLADRYSPMGPDQIVEFAVCDPAAAGDAARDDEHGHGHAGTMTPYRRLRLLLQPEARDIWAVVAFAVGVGGLTLATPIAVQMLVNTVAFGGLLQPLVVLSILLFFALALGASLRALQSYLVEVIQRRVFVRVMADLAQRLPRVRVSAFDRGHGPELVNRFFDVLTIQKVSAMLLLDGVAVVLQGGIGLVVLAFYHPLLLAFDIILLVSIGFVVFILGRGAVSTAIRESMAKYAVAGWLEELARHPISFKTSGGPELAVDRADSLARVYLQARGSHFRVVFRQVLGALSLQVIASTALLGIGGFLVIEGQLTLGQLIAAELIVTAVVASLAKLGKHLEAFYDLSAAVDKLGHLMDLPLESSGGEELAAPTATEQPQRGAAVTLHDVSFGYEPNRPILRGLNFSVAPGERVAVVGPSGTGKSSLIELLFGLRPPDEGRIELDGIDYRSLGIQSIRRQVAAVSGFELFDGTLIENVRMGRTMVTAAIARQALRAVGLLDGALKLPKGLETDLFTGGAPLSDGQCRRLMLARAIAGRPRLLVIDEALEVLDEVTRETVLATLLDPLAPWTLLLVTHTPQIARKFPRVIDLGALAARSPGSSVPATRIGWAGSDHHV